MKSKQYYIRLLGGSNNAADLIARDFWPKIASRMIFSSDASPRRVEDWDFALLEQLSILKIEYAARGTKHIRNAITQAFTLRKGIHAGIRNEVIPRDVVNAGTILKFGNTDKCDFSSENATPAASHALDTGKKPNRQDRRPHRRSANAGNADASENALDSIVAEAGKEKMPVSTEQPRPGLHGANEGDAIDRLITRAQAATAELRSERRQCRQYISLIAKRAREREDHRSGRRRVIPRMEPRTAAGAALSLLLL